MTSYALLTQRIIHLWKFDTQKQLLVAASHTSTIVWSVNFESAGVSVKNILNQNHNSNEIGISNLIFKQPTSAHPFHVLYCVMFRLD